MSDIPLISWQEQQRHLLYIYFHKVTLKEMFLSSTRPNRPLREEGTGTYRLMDDIVLLLEMVEVFLWKVCQYLWKKVPIGVKVVLDVKQTETSEPWSEV